jgi:hypothetical protein
VSSVTFSRTLLLYSLSLLLSFPFSSFSSLYSLSLSLLVGARWLTRGGPGHAEQRRDEQGPWGGGTTSRAHGAMVRRAWPVGRWRDMQGPRDGSVMSRARGAAV